MPASVGITISTNTSGDTNEISTLDAAHIHFREKEGPLHTYRCFTCADNFQADTRLSVMEHFANHTAEHTRFHSHCLYCGGKVHKYILSNNFRQPIDDSPQFYHDCSRWKRKVDR